MKEEELSEQEQALNRFKETTKILEESGKQLNDELKQVDKCFGMLVDEADPNDKAKALYVANKAKALLAKLKAGGNVNDIVKQLNNLR